jgi:urease accessory protein
MTGDEWLIWQLADTAFPVGGLAHSNGLEAAWHHGAVVDGPTLDAFVRMGLRQTARGTLRFVREARDRPEAFAEIDADCDLFLNNHVGNRASRAQGRAFLAATGRIFGMTCTEPLADAVRDGIAAAHLAPVFGAVMGGLHVSPARTDSLFLFMFARGCISGAVRLGIVGPLEGQQIQSRLQAEPGTSDSAVQTAPVLDLLQATQDRLYSRLFQS